MECFSFSLNLKVVFVVCIHMIDLSVCIQVCLHRKVRGVKETALGR